MTIVQHPNGNSYLFIDNRIFVSAYNETTKSVITVELDINGDFNDWEKAEIAKQPNHDCKNLVNNCYSGEPVPFGELYCNSCNTYFKEMNEYITNNNLQDNVD